MTVDVLILGSGQAGVPLAVRLANAGHRVALVERAFLGGTCINYGCTPTKTMIASARAAHVARTAARLGVHAGEVRVDFAAVVARKDAVVRRWRDGVARRLASAGERLRVIEGPARFVGKREIEVAGQRYAADTVIINTGARPAVPRIAGLETVPWLDNHRAMSLRELPRHLVVMGGGYIGCEMGQMFRRFGAAVTIVDRHAHLLAREDPDVAAALESAFRDEGIALVSGVEIERVARAGEELVLHGDGHEARGSHLLVAVGRRANTDDLGCDVAGVALDARGDVIVDDRYRTSAPGVFAVGDVTGGPQFTHSSWDDHRLLFDLLLGRGTRGRADRLVPYTVFTDPQVGHVGLHESEARARGLSVEVATMPFGEIARAIECDETAGVMKLVIDAADERILGATLVGADAGELVHIFVPLIQSGASARSIVDAEFVHPTFAEGVQTLVMRLPRYALDFQSPPNTRRATMGSTQTNGHGIEMKLEVDILPVSDVDRAKRFYAGLGWRLDADYTPPGEDFRVVQLTPPGSECSIIFGKGVTTAAPGSTQGLMLIVSDVAAARAELLAHGVEVSDVFHDGEGVFARARAQGRVPGPDPEGRSYRSWAAFSDPDGNGWLLQEVKTRLPGRGGLVTEIATLTELLREAEEHHGAYERTAPKHHWSSWYAAYIAARERGRSADDAAKDAALHLQGARS